MASINGPQLQAELAAAGIPVAVGLDGDAPYLVDAGGRIISEKAWPKEVTAVIAAHVPAPPPLTQPEQFDAVIVKAQAALEAASTLAQIKAVFAGTLDGLQKIYGTGGSK